MENAGQTERVEGERIFINTGATPIILPIKGLRESKYMIDSTQAMDLESLPEALVIIGAGYIGLEFASMFANYGSKVIILDAKEEFLAREDEDIAEQIYNDLTAQGIEFHLGISVDEVKDQADHTEITYTEKGQSMTIKADNILAATGRKPNIEGLGLENTDVKVTDRDVIIVDDLLRTDAPNVWAIGDVKGGLQFTYVSLDDYRIILDQLDGKNTRSLKDRTPVSYTHLTLPTTPYV